MICWHKWKEYKDLKTNIYYRICTKCGIAQEYKYDMTQPFYETNENLCRTNSWIDRETFRLKYGK